MACFPPCNPWCECINDKCQPKPLRLNAVRLRTLDGGYLTAVGGGGAGLTADNGTASQSATFLLVSRPGSSPLTIPPPPVLPWASGSPISLVVCDANWAASANLMRVEHSTVTYAAPPKHGFDLWRFLFGGTEAPIVTYSFGGPGTFLRVQPPFSSGYPAYTSDVDPLEWVFSIEKAGGTSINVGDLVSLRIDSGIVGIGPFYFRIQSSQNQASIGGDGAAPFQPDTLFVVEFLEARPNLGVRPDAVACQVCGPVTGTVKDASTSLPIANATVEAQGVLDNHIFNAVTDTSGAFALKDSAGRDCVPPGMVTLLATADRYQPKTTNPIPDPSAGGAVVPIRLDCTQVRGRVIDTSINKNPIGWVWVDLAVSDGTPFTAVLSNQLDGTFAFDCVPHGNATLSAAGTNMQVTVPPEGLFIEIKLDRDCVDIVGTVTDAVTHLPLLGVKVQYFGSSVIDTTNSQGSYKLHCVLPGGSQTLFPIKTGYQLKLFVVAPFPAFGTVTKDFELEPILFNTGVDDSGVPLPDGTIGDPHYNLVSVPSGTTAIRVRTAAGGYPVPPYIGDNSASAWIGPNNDSMVDGPMGQYTYRTIFGLRGGVVSPTTAITGKWSTDNDGVRILLNGVDTGIPPTTFEQFASGFAEFNITTGFIPNLNTLDFIVNNGSAAEGLASGPTALRVEMILTS
jgi:Carboxypeptidase regulatory-like domain